MTDNKTLADIARAAWLDCPLDGDHWEATAKAIRRAVIDECIQTIEEETSRASALGIRDWSRVDLLRSLKGETDNG